MQCVIISTKSEPFLSFSTKAPFLDLLGVKLIDRLLLTAQDAGIKDFVLVSASEDYAVRQHVDLLVRRLELTLHHAIAQEAPSSDGQALILASPYLKAQSFLVTSIDRVLSQEIFAELLATPLGEAKIILGVDENILSYGSDLSTVTRVQLDADGSVAALEPDLFDFHGLDTGLYLFSREALSQVLQNPEQTSQLNLVELIRQFIPEKSVRTRLFSSFFWSHIDSSDALQRTEQIMLSAANKDPTDGPIKQFVLRKFSYFFTQFSLVFKISVVQLSVYSFLISALAALFLSLNHYVGLLIGGLLAFLSIVLQVSRQEVIKLTYSESAQAIWLDNVLGQYGEIAVILGLMLNALHKDYFGMNPALIGILAIAGNFMFHYSAERFKQLAQHIPKDDLPFMADDYINRDVLYLLATLGALLNIPLFSLAVMMTLFNAIVLRRLFLWKL